MDVELNGFSHGATFRFTQPFQNKLFVAGDTSNMSTGPLLYSTVTGDTGSYVEETGFKSVVQSLQETQFSSSIADNNYMFLGTVAYFDTLADFAVPQVYRYDGTNYVKHGTINFNFPNSNQGYYSCIDRTALYSPTGSNDSIYAFAYLGAQNGISVWKAPAGVTNPTWVNSTNFFGSGISKVYDTKVWHKKLYITVATNANGGMILRTANGVDWDTVLTALSLQPHIGTFYYDAKFASLEVFRDTLITAISSNYTHQQALWYTSDSLTLTQNWKSFIDTASYSGITDNWYGVPDMQVADGKLWIQVNWSNQYPAVFVCTKNALGKDTLLRSSGSTPLENYSNSFDDYRMSYFNNALYSSGFNFPGARISNPNQQKAVGNNPSASPYYKGNIYRFKTINPTANFSDSVQTGTGYCVNNSIYLINSTINASSYAWYQNGVLFSSNQDAYYYPSVGQTDTIKLIAYNGTNQSLYKDSISKTILIHPNPVIGMVTASSYTVCQGQSDTLRTQVSGGTAPYTYTWHNVADNLTYNGDSTTIIQLYVVPTPSPYVYNYVTVKDANSCFGTGNVTYLNIYVNPGDSLSGTIVDTLLNPVVAGKVYLYKKQVNNMGIQDTLAVLGANGKYSFPSLFYGDYYVKAVADTNNLLYKTSVATYYSNKQNAFQWDSALVVMQHGCTGGNNTGNDIKILQIPNVPTGPGTITGSITQSNSFGARYSGPNSVFGAPLKGVDIKLGKNPGGSPAARTTSDTFGNYKFTNVPIGKYKIYVDIPNYGMDSVRAVDLTVSDTSVHNDYYVDSTMVRVVPIDSVSRAICAGDSIMLGGAYQLGAGYYTDVIQTFWGYDSVVVTNLSITPLPTLTVTTSSDSVCIGNSVVLTATGNGTSYLWSSNAGSVTSSTVSVSPTANATYTVTATVNSCPVKQTITVIAKNCVGIQNVSQQDAVSIYPNPATDKLFIQTVKGGYLKIFNIAGQIVLEQKINLGSNEISLNSLAPGAYEVNFNNGVQVTNTKVMLTK